MVNTLLAEAEQTVPKTKSVRRRVVVPWWNDECAEAVKARKGTLRKFFRHPCTDHESIYLEARRDSRRVLNNAKRNSWRDFVSQINCCTPPSEVWNSVRKITGRNKSSSAIKSLNTSTTIVTDHLDIANHIGQYYQRIYSDLNYPAEVLEIKRRKEVEPLSSFCDPVHPLNHPFSVYEFNDALSSRHRWK